MNSANAMTEQEAITKARAGLTGPRQFVRAYTANNGKRVVGRFVWVRGQRKPRLLDWVVIETTNQS